jgi:two-component system alkaline phosphatase synthesis response regulator PhoP
VQQSILIVDDDPDMLELLRASLKQAGYATRTAGTGKEALSQVKRCPPDLIVLDVLLPDINGFSVCEELRDQEATASLPIILMTVLPGEFPRLVGKELGTVAFLNKPFHVQEMVAQVERVLSLAQASAPGGTPVQEPAAQPAMVAGKAPLRAA